MMGYEIYIDPDTFQDLKNLPGNIRQRVRKAINDLRENPCPPQSKPLDLPYFNVKIWRVRLEKWRILYVIDETNQIIDIIAVRKRPPYNYGDLALLINKLKSEREEND